MLPPTSSRATSSRKPAQKTNFNPNKRLMRQVLVLVCLFLAGSLPSGLAGAYTALEILPATGNPTYFLHNSTAQPPSRGDPEDCPSELILSLLRRLHQDATSAGQPSPPPVFPWPPPALRQGLTCTMEVSQLSVSLPGSNRVCTVLSISNNLLSTLYSWQLIWQPAGSAGLTAVAATGAIMLNNTGR